MSPGAYPITLIFSWCIRHVGVLLDFALQCLSLLWPCLMLTSSSALMTVTLTY